MNYKKVISFLFLNKKVEAKPTLNSIEYWDSFKNSDIYFAIKFHILERLSILLQEIIDTNDVNDIIMRKGQIKELLNMFDLENIALEFDISNRDKLRLNNLDELQQVINNKYKQLLGD